MPRGRGIYDDEDQLSLMKQIVKELNLTDKTYRPGTILGVIGKAKNDLIGPDEYVPPSYWHEAVKRAYQRYQQMLADNNAVDFDDLIMSTVRLLRENPDLLARYQMTSDHVVARSLELLGRRERRTAPERACSPT